MTGSNDLERMLGSYLDDGPRRAPDRPVDAAIAFAVAHPRRPDPLRFLKSDVMARRGSMFGPQLVWVGALMALTLAAVAAIAIGTRPAQEPVVPPPVTTSPSPSASPSPPVRPSPSVITLELNDPNNGITWPVTITDASGTLLDAEPEAQQDVPPVDRIEATTDPADPTRVELVWTFCGASEPHTLTIDETGLIWRLERPLCSDTLGGADQRMTLLFSDPVDPESVDLELVDLPR